MVAERSREQKEVLEDTMDTAINGKLHVNVSKTTKNSGIFKHGCPKLLSILQVPCIFKGSGHYWLLLKVMFSVKPYLVMSNE